MQMLVKMKYTVLNCVAQWRLLLTNFSLHRRRPHG